MRAGRVSGLACGLDGFPPCPRFEVLLLLRCALTFEVSGCRAERLDLQSQCVTLCGMTYAVQHMSDRRVLAYVEESKHHAPNPNGRQRDFPDGKICIEA